MNDMRIVAGFQNEPETFEIKLDGRMVGLVVIEAHLAPMFPAYMIAPNMMIHKELKVHEILDFHLEPTRPYAEKFLELFKD